MSNKVKRRKPSGYTNAPLKQEKPFADAFDGFGMIRDKLGAISPPPTPLT